MSQSAANRTRPPNNDARFAAYVLGRRRDYIAYAYSLTGNYQEAEDIAAEAVANAWTSTQSRTIDILDFYIRRCIRNVVISRYRRTRIADRNTPKMVDDWRCRTDAPPSDDLLVDHDVLNALEQLPFDQRVVLAMRYLLDLSEYDTAGLLGIPAGTVKSRTSRGVTALRQILEQQSGNDHPGAPPADGHDPGYQEHAAKVS